MSLLQLEPKAVWKHFQMLCDIPRPSGREQQLREQLVGWAKQRGLSAETDEAGNLLIRKPARPGREGITPVVLQGHLDMVSQKKNSSLHHFERDPIQTRILDGWVYANDTTLGADNGLGVAAALAVLESTTIQHGPMEALFTVEEESSMRGALELRPDWLQGQVLLNLDSEDRGDVYVGCAGGVDVNVAADWPTVLPHPDWCQASISLSGLRGGHSGIDIDKGRANAIRLLARFLDEFMREHTLQLISFHGGTVRNALPRDARVTLALPPASLTALRKQLESFLVCIREEYRGIENALAADLTIQAGIATLPESATLTSSKTHGLDTDYSRRFIALLQAAPHGVEQMSMDYNNVVATSNNLGVITLQDGRVQGCLLARALRHSTLMALAFRIRSVFELADCQVTLDNAYPGWNPEPSSRLLDLFQSVHLTCCREPARVKVIHAGLECGIIGSIYPSMDMVSFGPVIRGAHSPEERAEIESVADFWMLLCALLEAMPVATDAQA